MITFSGLMVGIPNGPDTEDPLRRWTLDEVVGLLQDVLPPELHMKFQRHVKNPQFKKDLESPATTRSLVVGECDDCHWSVDQVDGTPTIYVRSTDGVPWTYDEVCMVDYRLSLSKRFSPRGYWVRPITDDSHIIQQLVRNRLISTIWSHRLDQIPGVMG